MQENATVCVVRLEQLMSQYPMLVCCREDILQSFMLIRDAYQEGKKLLIAGNGGSAADSTHIVGELMKSFNIHRHPSTDVVNRLEALYGNLGHDTAKLLEGALPAVALSDMTALSTAYMNDSVPCGVFAQEVYGLGQEGDVLLAISTSGNSANILHACMTAHAVGMKVVGLTGKTGGAMVGLCDSLVRVPAVDTDKVQEFHLPIYHTLCAMLELAFFGR